MKMELFQKNFNAGGGGGCDNIWQRSGIGEHFRRYAHALRFAIGLHGA